MKYWMLFIGHLFFALSAKAQPSLRLSGKSIPELRMETQKPLLVKAVAFDQTQATLSKEATLSYPTLKSQFSANESPKAWCYNDLALFCKLEVKLEKATRFPVRVRLGETQQVERMEGKLSDGLKKQ